MVYRMNPEDIKDNEYRRIYVNLLELDLDDDMSRVAFERTGGRFSAADFISYFNGKREFSEKQIRYINFVYDAVRRHKDASSAYKEKGFLDDLIKFIGKVANEIPVSDRSGSGHKGDLIQKMNELKNGNMLYGNQFSALKFCIGLLPAERWDEYGERYDGLCGKYWAIYRSLRDTGGEHGKSS